MKSLNPEILKIHSDWTQGLISDSEFIDYTEYYRELAFKDYRSNTGSCYINISFIDTLKTNTGVDLPSLTPEGKNIEVKESRSNNSFTIHPKEYEVSDYILLFSHIFNEFYLVPTIELIKINTKRTKRPYRIPQLKKIAIDIPKDLIKLIEFIRKIRTEGN